MHIPQKQCQTSEKRNAKCFFAHLIYISPQAETKIFFCLFEVFFHTSDTSFRKPENHAAHGKKTSRHLVKTPGHEI